MDDLSSSQKMAIAAVARMTVAHDLYRDQYLSMKKWVLASILAVNSASLVLLLGTPDIDLRSKAYAAGWFGTGVILILIFGIVQTVLFDQLAGRYLTASWRFERLLILDDLSQIDSLGEDEIDKLIKFDKLTGLLPIASLLSLCVAITITLEGLVF